MNYDVFISYNSADKQIAEAVCHYIEARRLRCFIAPRDIRNSDWAGCIDAAIKSAKAFVVVVSESSIISNEVAKEITLATRVSNYIFPIRIDNSELNGRMNYHLSAFHWIDAMTPPLERKLEELADRVQAALTDNRDNLDMGAVGSRNLQRQRLLSQSVRPRAEFTGRNTELEQIHSLFTGGANAVFLCGMGGIGKSEIAKAYACGHPEVYSTVVFASYETDLLHLMANDRAIPVENLQQASAAGGQSETTEDYYHRKMKVLRSVVNESTLLIIDNFDVESDPHLEDILSLPCKILLTSRTDFGAYGYESVKIGPMEDFEDLVKLFTRVDRAYASAEDQQAVRSIIRLLEGHTYAVSLTAAQMKAGRIKPARMLQQLQQEGLNIQTRSGFAREAGSKKATAYEYIQALFDFSALDEEACAILRTLACMGREGIDIDLFMQCCRIEDFGDISRMIDLNWVQLDEENDRIGLHMLVREMVWDRLQPTLENCAVLLEETYHHADNAWNKSYEENRSHSDLIYALMEAFPDPTIRELDWFEEYATFSWIMGRFDLAETCELKLYRLCVDAYGEISIQAGKQALRVAAVYHNQGDYKRARPWYEKGLVVQEAIDPESFEACIARAKVARSDAQSGDIETALDAFRRNLAILEKIAQQTEGNDPREYYHLESRISRAFCKMNIALIYVLMGRAEEALPLVQEAYNYLATLTDRIANLVYEVIILARVYFALGEYDLAADYLRKGMQTNLDFRGGATIDIMLSQEMLGDILAHAENYDQACQEYTLALVGREKYFPSDVTAIDRLEQKLTCAQQKKPSGLPFLDIWI